MGEIFFIVSNKGQFVCQCSGGNYRIRSFYFFPSSDIYTKVYNIRVYFYDDTIRNKFLDFQFTKGISLPAKQFNLTNHRNIWD